MNDIAHILYYFYRAKWRESSFHTREELTQWQNDNLRSFKQKILCHSPFYQPYLQQEFTDFPLMNKQKMMENFDEINTAKIKKMDAMRVALEAERTRDFTPMIQDYTVGLSSGTSGQRGVFLASRRERLAWAGIILAKALPQSIFKKQKIAFFLRANSNLYTTLSKHQRIEFMFFDLTQPIASQWQMLHSYSPDVLVAPASILKFITQAQEDGMINITPQRIFSVAEVLDPSDEIYIETVFGQKVHQIYQCTEGFLGIANSQGKIYLNEEYLYIEKEWLDKKSGRFIPIITDYSRHTQPIVRYRLDDILIEDKRYSGVFTCVKAIEGRCDDIFYFRKNEGGHAPIFPEALRQLMNASSLPFDEYQLIQTSLDNVEVGMQPPPSDTEKLMFSALFNDFCRRQSCRAPTISYITYQPPAPTMKLRRIVRPFSI